MRLSLVALAAIAAPVTLAVVASPAPGDAAAREDVAGDARAVPSAALAALQLVPNLGQWPEAVRYAGFGAAPLWLHDDGFTLRCERTADRDVSPAGGAAQREVRGGVVRTRFVGARTKGFEPGAPFATRRHFFVGDRARWRRDVPAFAEVTMCAVRPGIDVRFRPLPGGDVGARGGFEYDLLLAAGASLDEFVAECEGVDSLHVDAHGRLVAVVPTPDGACELVQHAPVAWQESPDGPRSVSVAFRLLGARRYGFVAEGLDPSLPTVVDPGVVWSTFLGGGASDRLQAMQWRYGVGVWVAGWTGSNDFPATPGAFATTGQADAFVAQLADDGQALVFATYLGGNQGEEVRALALGPGDTPTVVGFTASTDFPTTPGAAQSSYRGGSPFLEIGDGFVVRLASDGASLLGATYVGGLFDDVAEAVVVDPLGNAIVAGWTSSPDFPVTPGAVQPALGGLPIAQSDGFVCGVAADGTAVTFATYLGGASSEQLLGIDRNATNGDLVVAGWSLGADYPTTPFALRPTSGGGIDTVVTRLVAGAGATPWSTYLGGIGEDAGRCVHFAGDGSVWVGGFTSSVNYPATLNAPQPALAGDSDGFVSRISANGQTLVFSTLVGGPGPDRVRDLSVAAPGVLVVGEAGDGFPVTNDALQATFAGGALDAFVAFYDVGGAPLVWSTYLGGAGQDALACAALDDGGVATVAGWSFSSDFPLLQPGLQGQLLGAQDGVVVQFDLLTDLGEGVEVESYSSPTPVVVGDGDVEVLRFGLRNLTARWLAVDSAQLLVVGAGATPERVADLRVRRVDGAGELVGGPLPLSPGGLLTVPFVGLELPPSSVTELVVVATANGAPSGASVEVAAAIVDRAAWQLRALGAGAGPDVEIRGNGRAEGPVFVLGALPGDADDSGQRTVVDVRRLIAAVGTPAPAPDVDGDGIATLIDVAATKDAVLGRGTVFDAPGSASRGSWIALRCLLPQLASVQASLGGRSLVLGRATPRQLTMRVEHDQPPGIQELVVSVGGRVVFTALVDVQ